MTGEREASPAPGRRERCDGATRQVQQGRRPLIHRRGLRRGPRPARGDIEPVQGLRRGAGRVDKRHAGAQVRADGVLQQRVRGAAEDERVGPVGAEIAEIQVQNMFHDGAVEDGSCSGNRL